MSKYNNHNYRAHCDFVVKYDPKKDKPEDLTKRILYSVIIKRLKAHKPAVWFIGGDSGEGKSFGSLRIQELLMEIQGLVLKDYIDDMNVYIPIQYPQKLKALLNEKRLKKANIICIHEAREAIKAKNWHTFINTAISDVNAMSRSIKRLCVIIISQFIRDIDSNMRYTLNFYSTVSRPRGRKARLKINVLWKDDRDLEKPKLRKRRLSGYVVLPSGRYRRYIPSYLELSKPDKDIVKQFEAKDLEAKKDIIERKMQRLINEMKVDMDMENKKVSAMVDFYSKNTSSLTMIGRRYGTKWRVNKGVRQMHDLNEKELKEFQTELNTALQKKGFFEKREKNENINELLNET